MEKSLLMRDYCLLFLFNPKFETKRTFFGKNKTIHCKVKKENINALVCFEYKKYI